jgi:hypothetical protein
VDTLGDSVLRYLLVARGLSADEIEPAWRDAFSAIIWQRTGPTTYLLAEAERLAVPEASIAGAWGYALEKAELRDESDTRRRVWALVAMRTEGRRVTRHEVLPESDPDFLIASDAYERLTFQNLLCDWRDA